MKSNELRKLVKKCIVEVLTEKLHPQDPSLEYPDYRDGDGRLPANPVGKWSLPNNVHEPSPCDKCGGKWSVGHKCSSKLKEVSGVIKPEKLSNGERNQISKAFAKLGLDGNGRFPKIETGLAAVTDALSSLGFQLDMVSKDMIMGDKGSRMLTYRRVNDPGQDIYTEKPEIQNSRIAFNWENLSQQDQIPQFEILAYAS
jgi:hypothetical protein